MSQPAPNTSLSLSTRLLCYTGPPSVILFTTLASPRTGLLCPLAFIPTAGLYRKWQNANERDPSRRAKLQPLVWTYATTGTLGLTAVALVQIGICKAVSAFLFSSETRKVFWKEFARTTVVGLTAGERTRRAKLASSWQNWVFNGALSFLAAGFFEEALKYLPIFYARHWGSPEKNGKRRDRAYIDYAVAGALSFGVIETIGTLYASCERGQEAWPKLALAVVERVVFGQLAHLSVAALTALRAIRRDYYGDQLSWWSVVGPAALLHGAFDFVCLSASALEGNVGWIHPSGLGTTFTMLGLCSSLVATAVWKVRQEWMGLNDRDRVRDGADTDYIPK